VSIGWRDRTTRLQLPDRHRINRMARWCSPLPRRRVLVPAEPCHVDVPLDESGLYGSRSRHRVDGPPWHRQANGRRSSSSDERIWRLILRHHDRPRDRCRDRSGHWDTESIRAWGALCEGRDLQTWSSELGADRARTGLVPVRAELSPIVERSNAGCSRSGVRTSRVPTGSRLVRPRPSRPRR
jgi:hypothetical protein